MKGDIYRLLKQLTIDASSESLKYQNDLIELQKTYREQRDILLSKMLENRENYKKKFKLLKMKISERDIDSDRM